MFDGIGKKIMAMAKTLCWVGIIVSIIIGMGMLSFNPLSGLLTGFLGVIFSWIGSWIMYSWGEVVDNISKIKTKIVGDTEEEKRQSLQEWWKK